MGLWIKLSHSHFHTVYRDHCLHFYTAPFWDFFVYHPILTSASAALSPQEQRYCTKAKRGGVGISIWGCPDALHHSAVVFSSPTSGARLIRRSLLRHAIVNKKSSIPAKRNSLSKIWRCLMGILGPWPTNKITGVANSAVSTNVNRWSKPAKSVALIRDLGP